MFLTSRCGSTGSITARHRIDRVTSSNMVMRRDRAFATDSGETSPTNVLNIVADSHVVITCKPVCGVRSRVSHLYFAK
jgi:hypothetical protein